MLRDSLYNYVKHYLTLLGWFDSGRQHSAINMIPKAIDSNDSIPMNTLALSDAEFDSTEWEMGSVMTEDNWTFYFDFYAEDDAIGIHIIQDVKAILDGKFASLGQIGASFPIYDYREATPSVVAHAEIENASIAKAQDFPKPWQRHWYALRFDVLDYVTDDLVD
jgi:hypothetical protein